MNKPKDMMPSNIPYDINIELLLAYFAEGSCKVSFSGLHKRNAYNDLIRLEESSGGKMQLTVGRASLYNSLPELMFHPIDRFDNLPYGEEKEVFDAEYEAQEREKENAHRFFAPIDLMLLRLRLMVRERLNVYAETDKVMIDILGDEITDTQRNNRFIKKTMPFLPFCKTIRGNKINLTLMLRKIFMEEGLSINLLEQSVSYTDDNPRYLSHLDGNIEDIFVGNTFDERTTTYLIHFWPDDEDGELFLHFVDEVEVFSLFVQDYFMAIDETIRFDISCDNAPVCLSDKTNFNYMNYNMNI